MDQNAIKMFPYSSDQEEMPCLRHQPENKEASSVFPKHIDSLSIVAIVCPFWYVYTAAFGMFTMQPLWGQKNDPELVTVIMSRGFILFCFCSSQKESWWQRSFSNQLSALIDQNDFEVMEELSDCRWWNLLLNHTTLAITVLAIIWKLSVGKRRPLLKKFFADGVKLFTTPCLIVIRCETRVM